VGLPFRDLVHPDELPWERLAHRRIAVDGYNAVYQFLATIRQADGLPFSDPNGHATSHLIGVFYRTTALLGEGVEPVWVFDGKPSDLKAGTIRSRLLAKEKAEAAWKEAVAAGDLETARRKAAQTSRFSRGMVEEVRGLLDALGVPSIQAPSEGEAQAAVLAARGQVWAAGSEDYDSLLFGAPRLVRGLAARAKGRGAPAAQVIDRAELLRQLGLDGEELLLVGLLVGTDFNEGATGYGPKKALKLAQRHLGWAETLRVAGLDAAAVEPVAELFRHPVVDAVTIPPFRPVDEAAVERLLVEQHGFSPDRVRSAIGRARRRPPAGVPGAPVAGRQTMLDAFEGGGSG